MTIQAGEEQRVQVETVSSKMNRRWRAPPTIKTGVQAGWGKSDATVGAGEATLSYSTVHAYRNTVSIAGLPLGTENAETNPAAKFVSVADEYTRRPLLEIFI